MLAGARLHLEAPNLTVDGIYTFGQPRTCDRVLAAACNKGLAKRIHRFVNNNDIVPQLPPEPAFTHVDTLRYIGASGKVRESMTLLGGLADRAKGLTADPFAPAGDGVRDHAIGKYIAALRSNLSCPARRRSVRRGGSSGGSARRARGSAAAGRRPGRASCRRSRIRVRRLR